MIEKRIKIDKIEIVGDFRVIQTRLKVEIVEDGVVIGDMGNHRLSAKSPDEDITAHPDITVGKQKMPVPQDIKDRLQGIAAGEWTQDIKNKWAVKKAKDEADNPVDNKPK